MCIRDRGTLIDPFQDGFAAAFEQTEILLKGEGPVFEAAFTAKGALALADVMLPVTTDGQKKWKMIEVKSSASVKGYQRDDVAVQSYIANEVGVDLESASVACIDSKWTYPGDGDYSGLLKEADLTEASFNRFKEVEDWIDGAQATLIEKAEPKIEIGGQCTAPYECSFISYCNKDNPVSEYPVQWIPRRQKKELKEFIADNEIVDMEGVPDSLLNEVQQRVKHATLSGEIYFDHEGAGEFLGDQKYPAYFIDFETINLAIPRWAGTRPFQQVPFQFSVHVLLESGEVEHKEFLDISGTDPREGFARELLGCCGESGPVYVYNIGFERGKIVEIAEAFPEYADGLLAIADRLVDLLLLTRKYYYHPDQHGSWSIKAVLPTVVPELRYDDLDGVQDGGMAMDAFEEAISDTTSAERKEEIRTQLLKYCELDTYAMVKLWGFFRGTSHD